YSPRCSCTNRTARSRTSGENLLFLLMAPFSQKLEPPQNPGRFKERNELLREIGDLERTIAELTAEVRFLKERLDGKAT
ncbi:hypothetical protein N6G06_26575, partial [Cupriavidus gilardii]|uniref:hypothetical protein n=1 Tax=Cupriavidus gilardii TaxID=82541 RepID=UPI0021BEE772